MPSQRIGSDGMVNLEMADVEGSLENDCVAVKVGNYYYCAYKYYPRNSSGDTVKVHLRIVEGEKERIQVFQGNVIRIKRGTTSATFTVRKVSDGVGVERIFPLNSPFIDRVELITQGRVRRSRLYYLRALKGKAARIKPRGRF